MPSYGCVIFDLYNTIIDDQEGYAQREKYRIDTIYTILEKGLFPVRFGHLTKKYGELSLHTAEMNEKGIVIHPFDQVGYLLNELNVRDIVIYKKIYDAFVDAIVQIAPKAMHNADKALAHLKENGKKIGLVSNTGKTPGHALRLMLKDLGLYDYFDVMIFSDELGLLKPDPLVFDIAVRRLGAQKGETVFVGDLKGADHDGAVKAGLNAHLFNKEKDDLFKLAVEYCGGY